MNGMGDPDCRKCFEWNSPKWNQKIFAAMKLLIKIHKEKIINERDYSIEVVNDLVVITRKSLQNSIILYMNLSGDTKYIPEIGKPLVVNKYHAYSLENKGFVIIEK
jgi:hypothetical protein